MTRAIRLGLLRLVDSAPILLAAEQGFFAAENLEVVLSVEPSWANIADKLSYGALDAAVILPPLAIAMAAGLRQSRRRLILPMSLSTGGNALTLSAALARQVGPAGTAGERAARFRSVIARQPPPRLAVVHGFSTHNLLLRTWLATGGVDPDRDVEIVTLAPEATAEALAAGTIDGFCAGAPWGAAAESNGAGIRLLGTTEIWPAHPEKALAVDAAFAAAEPDGVQALLRALLRAGPLCDDTERDEALLRLLTPAHGLALPEAATRAALAGPDRPVFAAAAAQRPRPDHAAWFAAEMRRWGWLDREPPELYRPDLFDQAARDLGMPYLRAASDGVPQT